MENGVGVSVPYTSEGICIRRFGPRIPQALQHHPYIPHYFMSSIFREFDVLRYVASCTTPHLFPNDRMLLTAKKFGGPDSVAILLGADRFAFMASLSTMKQFEKERGVRFLGVQETEWVCIQLWGVLEHWKARYLDRFPGSLVCRYPVPLPPLPAVVEPEDYTSDSVIDWDSLYEFWVTLPEADSDSSSSDDSVEEVEEFARFLMDYFNPKKDQSEFSFLTTRREGWGNRPLRVSDADIARAGIDWYRYT